MTEQKYKPVRDLFKALGFIDPCPGAGKWNKTAMKKRSQAASKINIDKYRVGSERVNDWGGGYLIEPVYEYQGVKYCG